VQIQNPGTYTITVVASNIAGSATATQVIQVSDCSPVATFSLDASWACRPDTILGLNQTQVVSGAGNNTNTWLITPSSSSAANGNYVQSTATTVASYPQSRRFIFAALTNTAITAGVTFTVKLTVTNSVGTSTAVQTIRVEQQCWVGISENSLSENMSVYPNPAHEQLTLSLPDGGKNYNVKLVNVLGSVVYESNVKNSTTVSINITDKAKGIYFLTVESNGEKATKKIIVE